MSYLLLISIGPVQDFIASARRTRDLWYGSWLLSELAKTAARTIAQQEGLEQLIFPAPSKLDELTEKSALNVANKIVAKISRPDAQSSQTATHSLATKVENALISHLDKLRADAYKHITGDFYQDIAIAQVRDMLEYYWVAVPLEKEEEYPDVRTQAESLLSARKVTRQFEQVPWGQAVPKSSLDGVRESVILDDLYSQLTAEQLFIRYGARPAERLSGVDLLKRHGHRGPNSGFPSTSHIAALPFLAGLGENVPPTWQDYLEWLMLTGFSARFIERIPARYKHNLGRYDASVLFTSRLEDELSNQSANLDQDAIEAKKETLADVRHALQTFLNDTPNPSGPLPYYALLLADGDRMGSTIDNQSTIKAHQDLSRALNDFAGSVADIVELEYGGALVYAGGDDVLAFLPLHTVLACAKELGELFKLSLSDYQDAAGHSPTFSAGIAIAHHLEPLEDTLNLARQAEKAAKSVPGDQEKAIPNKDALAIIMSKRSGANFTIKGKWGKIDERLELFIKLHRQDALPDGAAYQLRDLSLRLALPLIDPERMSAEEIQRAKEVRQTLRQARRHEALRILARKRAEHGQRWLSEDKEVWPQLEGLFGNREETGEKKEKFILISEPPIEELADEIIIARLFANALDQAYGPLSTVKKESN